MCLSSGKWGGIKPVMVVEQFRQCESDPGDEGSKMHVFAFHWEYYCFRTRECMNVLHKLCHDRKEVG